MKQNIKRAHFNRIRSFFNYMEVNIQDFVEQQLLDLHPIQLVESATIL